MLTPL